MRGERGRRRGGGVGKGVGGVDVGRKSRVWEVLVTGERMGLSVGPAASGATWEARVAGLLVWQRAGTSMKKFALRISGGAAEEGGQEGKGRGALVAAPGEPAGVVPMFRAENITDGDGPEADPDASWFCSWQRTGCLPLSTLRWGLQ
jgi:hypothetical protein